MKPHYIYAMRSESGPVKIGRSVNVKARRSNIQSDHGYKLSIVHVEPVAEDLCPNDAERECHRVLRDRRLLGEWFDATDEEAIMAIKKGLVRCRNKDRTLLVPDDPNVWSREDLSNYLREEADRIGTMNQLALIFDVSLTFLSDVINMRREPGNAILKRLGRYRRVRVDYPEVEEKDE